MAKGRRNRDDIVLPDLDKIEPVEPQADAVPTFLETWKLLEKVLVLKRGQLVETISAADLDAEHVISVAVAIQKLGEDVAARIDDLLLEVAIGDKSFSPTELNAENLEIPIALLAFANDEYSNRRLVARIKDRGVNKLEDLVMVALGRLALRPRVLTEIGGAKTAMRLEYYARKYLPIGKELTAEELEACKRLVR